MLAAESSLCHGQKIILTGASGMVGRATAALLRRQGAEVVSICGPGSAAVGELRIDLSENALNELSLPVDVIVHLAAALPHNARYTDLSVSSKLTRQIDRNVLAFAKSKRVYVIYASTCSLYDTHSSEFKKESANVFCPTAYQAAKLSGEEAFLDLQSSAVLRLSNPYGFGMFASTVLPRFISSARRGEAVEYWGKGLREQDFVATSDIARLISLAITHRAAGVFNVASSRPVTMHKLAETVVTAIGAGTVQRSKRADPLEGCTARYDTTKAFELLGWKAEADFIEGIRSCSEEIYRV